jgi:hypothetical protein
MTTKKLMGLFASVALLGSGMALANDQTMKSKTGEVTQQVGGNQLTGRVVKSDSKMVWLEHSGAIVPLRIDKNTQFSDPNLQHAKDLKEGDEIRASFEVRKTDNVATSITRSTTGTGGSGLEMTSPDSSIRPSPGTLPPSHEGTGGSGSDVFRPDIDRGTGSDVNSPDVNRGRGSDLNPNQNKTSGDY